MKWWMKNRYNLILFFVVILFFGLYSFNVWSLWLPNFSAYQHLIFNWPDTNANYFFAKLFAEQNTFAYPEKLNLLSDNLLHTRSINVYEGNLVPMTFLPAVYIFALFFKMLGSTNILWLTPLLASLSACVVFRLSKHIFQDKHLAFLIALLFLALAPWLYFANVVMLPSILFIFLLLVAWLFYALYFQQVELIYWTLASIFLSLAVLVRPTEFVWVLFSALLVFLFNRRKVSFFLLLITGVIFANFLFMALYLNKITYGNYLSIGYQNLQTGALPTEFGQNNWDYVGFLKLAIMPFGFDLKLIAYNFYNYFVEIVWPYLIFVLASLYYLYKKIKLKQSKRKIWLKYFAILATIFILILLYYGSWDLADPLVKNLNKISISYIRYFLPLYILIVPMTAYGIKRLFWREDSFVSSMLVYFMIILVSVVSVRLAFFSPNDGLLKNNESITEYYEQYKIVSEIVPVDSIIISDRSDKIFFPKYKVIVSQGDLPLWPRVANLIERQDVYFYTNKTDSALQLTKDKAAKSSLNFSEGKDIYNNFRLFKINN